MDIRDRILKEIIKDHNCESVKYYIDITNEFCNIFGNAVKQVKIELDECFGLEYEDYLKEIEEKIYRMAENMLNFVNIYLKENRIDLDGMNLYITFFNGETIKIWNADCGGIEKYE